MTETNSYNAIWPINLFGEAMEDQARIMMQCMSKFCAASGERVSINESSISLSHNVKANLKAKIKNITGMKWNNEIGRYLGFPLT